jgi:hypothetical protein
MYELLAFNSTHGCSPNKILVKYARLFARDSFQTNSVALSPQAKYTEQPKLVSEI